MSGVRGSKVQDSEVQGFRGSGFNEKIHSDNPYMKLRQNGTVSFSIKLAAFQASGWAERGTLNGERLNLN